MRVSVVASTVWLSLREISIKFARWIDAFWGYDVFISHRHSDASGYARMVYELLNAERISCFIDQVEYGPGDSLLVGTRRHIAKSQVFLLLGSPDLLVTRRPVDWVALEIQTYLASHVEDPRLVLVDFGNTVSHGCEQVGEHDPAIDALLSQVQPFLSLREDMAALASLPSQAILDAVRRHLTGRRRDQMRLMLFKMIAAILLVLFVASTALGGFAWWQKGVAQANLAEAIRNDGRRLATESGRQRAGGYSDLAVMLAREALNGSAPGRSALPRPYIDEAALALALALSDRPMATEKWQYQTGVQLVTLSPDGLSALILLQDGTAEIRSMNGSAVLSRWHAHDGMPHAAAFHPDGKTVATVAHDGLVKLWNVSTGRESKVFRSDGPARSVKFNRAGDKIIVGSDDGRARVWRVDRAGPLNEFACASNSVRVRAGQTPIAVLAASFSPDDEQVVIACASGEAEIWDIKHDRRRLTIRTGSTALSTVVFSPDGRTVLTGSDKGALSMWSAKSGELIRQYIGHEGRIRSAIFTRDSRHILSASDDKTAALWDSSLGQRLHVFRGHTFYVMSAEFSHDELEVITASWDNSVRRWQIGDRELRLKIPLDDNDDGGVTSIEFSPTADKLVAGTWHNGGMILNSATGEIICKLHGKEGVLSVAFSQDGRRAATAWVDDNIGDGVVTVWDANTCRNLVSLPAQKEGVASVAFSSDGKLLMVAGDDGVISLWDRENGAPLGALPMQPDAIQFASFNPRGDRILFASRSEQAEGAVWDLKTQAIIFTLPGIKDAWSSAVFNATGTRIIAGDLGGNTIVYDAANGRPLITLPWQNTKVNYAEFSPDGALIVTALDDGTATLWEATSGRPIGAYNVNESLFRKTKANNLSVNSARFSLDGRRIALAINDGTVRIWEPAVRSYRELVAGALRKRTLSKNEKREFGLP